jgi:hypothetical protein
MEDPSVDETLFDKFIMSISQDSLITPGKDLIKLLLHK